MEHLLPLDDDGIPLQPFCILLHDLENMRLEVPDILHTCQSGLEQQDSRDVPHLQVSIHSSPMAGEER